METRAHYVLIGAFVLSAVAMAFLFILWLGQTQREFDEYDVIFRERVSGLSEGAAVRFNGIQKGEVTDLSIDPDDPSIVVARVRVERDTPVKTDTRAELELVGFTGLAIIQFVGGSREAELLKEVQRGVPKLEADTSGFAAFLEGSGDIVAAANRLLSDDNTEAVNKILTDIAVVSGVFAEREAELSTTIANAAAITSDVAEATAQLSDIVAKLDGLLSNEAPQTLAETEETIRAARALIADLNAVVAENREPLAMFAEQGLGQIGPAVAEARRLMRTLDQILSEVDRDPRGYLLGESTPRYEAEQPQ